MDPSEATARTGSVLRRPATELLLGGCLGVTWAAALRAYMHELVGDASTFTWSGTFGGVLLPGAIAGAGIALAMRRQERDDPRAWLPALGLLAFGALPLLRPGAIEDLVTTGNGSAGFGVVAALLLGGFGLGDRGRRSVRVAALVVSGLLAIGVAATVPAIGGGSHSLTTPRGAWVVTLALGLMTTGVLATSHAFRRRVPRR